MKKRRQLGKVRIAVNIIVMLVTVFLVYKVGTTMFNYARQMTSQSSDGDYEATGETVSILIPEGSSTKEIAKLLNEKGLISSTLLFRMKSKSEGLDGSFKQGTYEFDKGMDDNTIMEMLQQGAKQSEKNKITIPEGYTIEQISAYLEEKGIVTAADFKDNVNNGKYNYAFLSDVPVRKNYLEGYLFPDTYFLNDGATSEDIINKMLKRFDDVYNEDYKKAVESSKYSLDEIITIASIIEAEIQVPEEREIASGVIYNRMEEEMPLQMCSTVLYAMGKRKDGLLLEDLEIDSPYNTYKNAGLPKGPISNPGEAAIKAAIYPQENDFLFFVLKAEDQGEHVFTKTYDEFLAAKEKYKQKF